MSHPQQTQAPAAVPVAQFELLVDLGTIVVPEGYDPAKCLATFRQTHGREFFYYSADVNDRNFASPSRVLKAGEKLRVRAYRQAVSGTTTSEERVTFLKAQTGAVLVGAQGVPLVFQKRDELRKGLWYCSFDEKERLWKDPGRDHRVPALSASSDGDFRFILGRFEDPWYDYFALLSFCDEAL